MVDIRDFGPVDLTGATPTTALQNAINAVASGQATGPIFIPAGIIQITSQIVIPNNSNPPTPDQLSIRIVGAGRAATAGSGGPGSFGGTVLNLLYGTTDGDLRKFSDAVLNGTTLMTSATGFTSADVGKFVVATGVPSGTVIASVSGTNATLSNAANVNASNVAVALQGAKIVSIGFGTLAIEHLTLWDSSAPTVTPGIYSVPFLYVTNTTVHLTDVVFWGNGQMRTNSNAGKDASFGANSTTITSTNIGFVSADAGATIFAGTNQPPLFPVGTTIISASGSTCTTSQASLGAGTNTTLTVMK